MKPRRVKFGDPHEVELKLYLPPDTRAAIEASPVLAAAQAKQHHLVTTYFDTPDRLLHKTGLTLRVRRCGRIYVQTVKSRANDCGLATDRSEWEWRTSRNVPDISLLAKTHGLAIVARGISGLESVFVTDVLRTTRLLHLGDNTIVEAAIDEGCIKAGTSCERISELELELKAGPIGPMYQLALDLQTIAPLWISPESKPARGWYLRTGVPRGEQHAHKLELRRSVQAAAGFREILGRALALLMANIGPTLRGNVEGLHQMRLALRRSRAVLDLFGRHLDADAVDRFNEALRRFGKILGTARDWDVFCMETLPAAMEELPGERLQDLRRLGDVKRRISHTAMADSVRGHDFTKMLLSLAIWAEAGLSQPSSLGDDMMGDRLGALAPSLLDRAAGRVKKRARHVSRLSTAQRHALRKSLKKLLYDVESVAGLYPARRVKIYHHRCKTLLEILGVANDAVVTQGLIRMLEAARRPMLKKPARSLTRWSGRRSRKALHDLKVALKMLRTTPEFWS